MRGIFAGLRCEVVVKWVEGEVVYRAKFVDVLRLLCGMHGVVRSCVGTRLCEGDGERFLSEYDFKLWKGA